MRLWPYGLKVQLSLDVEVWLVYIYIMLDLGLSLPPKLWVVCAPSIFKNNLHLNAFMLADEQSNKSFINASSSFVVLHSVVMVVVVIFAIVCLYCMRKLLQQFIPVLVTIK